MEPRPYARLSVGALALRFAMAMPSPSTESSSATSRNSSLSPSSSSSSSTAAMAMAAAAATANHQDPSPSSSPYFCKVKLSHFKSQIVSLPVLPNSAKSPEADLNQASFYLDDAAIAKLHSSSIFCRPPYLCITVYRTEKKAMGTCYRRGSSTMGRFLVAMEAEIVNRNGGKQICHGWVKLGKKGSRRSWCAELHVCVRVDLDPRYIFQFDGQPERNPQIVQIQGNIRQPIFSCKFTCDRSFRTMGSSNSEGGGGGGEGREEGGGLRRRRRRRRRRERKGWLVLIYDLSGAAVAAASMVTPFVASQGSERVSKSNPGAWLIMKAGPMGEKDCWLPWGRLEAWLETTPNKLFLHQPELGFRFHLLSDPSPSPPPSSHLLHPLAFHHYPLLSSETILKPLHGDRFLIDISKLKPDPFAFSPSPVDSPHSSGDFYFGYGNSLYGSGDGGGGGGGFVMSANVKMDGKSSHPPRVELAMRHVNCVGDAAVFMALAAAVDLSIDACLPFSRKLGKNFMADEE